MITPQQRHTIDCIVSIFETGKIPTASSYSTVTILQDGAGISYGKHQSTDGSNSLDKIVTKYIAENGSKAPLLKQYVDELVRNDSTKVDPKNPPSWAKDLMSILKEAGADPIMQKAQDSVFDENYWIPAYNKGVSMGMVLPLTYAVLYDTCIHSGIGRIDKLRDMFAELPPIKGGDEKKWCYAFLAARRSWLLSNPNPLVQRTIYRIDSLKLLADKAVWDLKTPIIVRSVTIS